jgi:hypothetical protein
MRICDSGSSPRCTGLTHTVAARLSQLDYDRELALLAEYDGIALGVAHLFADPDGLRAEYAIAVRNDWKGRALTTAGGTLSDRVHVPCQPSLHVAEADYCVAPPRPAARAPLDRLTLRRL